MTHLVPCLDSSPTPSHMHMPSVKTVIYVPSMTIFPKQKLFCFINQNPLDKPQMFIYLVKSRVFMHLWATDFLVFTTGHRTPSQHFYGLSQSMIMSNCNYRVFYPMRYRSLLDMPNTRIFHAMQP